LVFERITNEFYHDTVSNDVHQGVKPLAHLGMGFEKRLSAEVVIMLVDVNGDRGMFKYEMILFGFYEN